uniref:AP180 N-terminal homology (ANTH) domain-containing protein n=1 Tax=Magallana gigas TaxID=29159 RepID=A0A8W8J084_MAGGI
MWNPRVFGDNAYDPDVNASELWIDKRDINGKTCLNFTDNGNGLVQEKLHKMLSFGYCEKVAVGNHQPIGHHGNGFKSGSMRLGKDAIVFSRRMDVMSVGLLSQTYLKSIKVETVLVPIVSWDLPNSLFSSPRRKKYFDMNKKQCKDTLEIYKRFLVRMDKVSEFLKTAESVGIDKSDIPDLAKAPSSLLDALEQHYQSLEGKKGVTTPVSGSKPVGFAAAINTISSNTPTINVSEEERQRILDEENARLQQLKVENSVVNSSPYVA